MTLIAEPHPRREPAFRPQRSGTLWRIVMRYQLVELFVIIGVICLAWLGAVSLGNIQL
jgi:hypothetical protein